MDADEKALIEYDGVEYGSYFDAYICGDTQDEVFEKLSGMIGKIKFLTTFDSVYSDEMYMHLMNLKEEVAEERHRLFSSGIKRFIDFEFIRDRKYKVYL